MCGLSRTREVIVFETRFGAAGPGPMNRVCDFVRIIFRRFLPEVREFIKDTFARSERIY